MLDSEFMVSPASVLATSPALRELAERYHIPLCENLQSLADGAFYLAYEDDALALHRHGVKREKPLSLHFDLAQHQRRQGRGKELLLKAIGGGGRRPKVLDLSAGLGGDAFVLAGYGCSVLMCERVPVVAALLDDALRRYPDCGMRLLHGDSMALLASPEAKEQAEVVYFDPMFPESKKSAAVKKAMQYFHSVVGKDEDAAAVFERAYALAEYRVVVKRPLKAPLINDRQPNTQIKGKAVRFDIYSKKTVPKNS